MNTRAANSYPVVPVKPIRCADIFRPFSGSLKGVEYKYTRVQTRDCQLLIYQSEWVEKIVRLRQYISD
jgi:hypothetical protein